MLFAEGSKRSMDIDDIPAFRADDCGLVVLRAELAAAATAGDLARAEQLVSEWRRSYYRPPPSRGTEADWLPAEQPPQGQRSGAAAEPQSQDAADRPAAPSGPEEGASALDLGRPHSSGDLYCSGTPGQAFRHRASASPLTGAGSRRALRPLSPLLPAGAPAAGPDGRAVSAPPLGGPAPAPAAAVRRRAT
eukprot:TRINITY_DN9545_c0_g2_i1.p3 TRINITY_DN9545_c0_g2~~TRINITY_DN9545_c0_g2_i1.p3  ORF type:complete len:222 (+),score=78.62 TRINITY_DN9545_c0_g2_i1:94-666(+)